MKIALIVFAYNRPESIHLVLQALVNAQRREELDIIVYSDGARDNSQPLVTRVREIILGFETIFKEINFRECNFGLKKNITLAINDVIKRYEAFIVIEDDIVISPSALSYCITHLLKYKNDEGIGHINLWNYPIISMKKAYLSNYLHCWGWATWSDRWDKSIFLENNITEMRMYDRFRISKFLSTLHFSHLYANMIGVKKTWAIFWLTHNIMKKRRCISPPMSFVENIGWDCGENVEEYQYSRVSTFISKIAIIVQKCIGPENLSWLYMVFKTPKLSIMKTLYLILLK